MGATLHDPSHAPEKLFEIAMNCSGQMQQLSANTHSEQSRRRGHEFLHKFISTQLQTKIEEI